MREREASLQEYGEFLLKAQLVKEKAAPYCVRWVRAFLSRPASPDPLEDQVRRFCDDLERQGREDWQVRQAEQALRIYFVNFLRRTDWHRRPTSASAVVDEAGRTTPLGALEQLRLRLRTRHYSYRTECSYADWVRRFLAYLAERQGAPHPRVDSDGVRDYLTHRPCDSTSRPVRRIKPCARSSCSAGRCSATRSTITCPRRSERGQVAICPSS